MSDITEEGLERCIDFPENSEKGRSIISNATLMLQANLLIAI